MRRAETETPSRALHTDSASPARRLPADGAARDAYIAGRLVTVYALCEQLAPFGLQADVKDGIATISGIVDDKVLRELALDLAEDLEGVREVRNEIVVEAGAPHRDPRQDAFAQRFENANVCARVKTRLMWNGATHNLDIEVSADNGTVTLSGTVANERIRELAGQLASEVRGCLHVDNRLQVRTGH